MFFFNMHSSLTKKNIAVGDKEILSLVALTSFITNENSITENHEY
jgi:hypothetical protein